MSEAISGGVLSNIIRIESMIVDRCSVIDSYTMVELISTSEGNPVTRFLP